MNKADGFTSLVGGQNAGMKSHLLQPSQYFFGLNISCRGGDPHTRPAFIPTGVNLGAYETGRFQGSKAYRLSSLDRLILVIDGHVLGVDTTTFAVTDYSAQANVGTLDPNVPRCYFCQADHYMIVQDGINPAVIIHENTARRSTLAAGYEIPVGTIMAYGHGRIFMVPQRVQDQDGRRFWMAGDIMIPTNPENVLKFRETMGVEGMGSGGAFSLPGEFGIIMGMEFLQNSPSGSGYGALVVYGKHGVSSFDVDQPRAQWTEVNISHVLFKEDGTLSPRSIVTVNADMYYRGKDGIRTIGASVNEIGKKEWGTKTYGIRNSPISREVASILERDNAQTVLPYVEMAVCGNRLFCTSVIDTTKSEPMFKALVVLDADVVSSITTPSSPIWDGAWTGHNFMGLTVARNPSRELNAMFAFVKTEDGKNDILRLSENEGYVAGYSEAIQCRIYTRGFTYEDLVNQKEFLKMSISISGVQGTTALKAYYKPLGYPLYGQMDNGFVQTVQAGLGHRRQNLVLSPTGKEIDPVLQTYLTFGWGFEFVVEWEGYMEIEACSFLVDIKPEPPNQACQMLPATIPIATGGNYGVDLDPFGPWSIDDPFDPTSEISWVTIPFMVRRGYDGKFYPFSNATWNHDWWFNFVRPDGGDQELPLPDPLNGDVEFPPLRIFPQDPFMFTRAHWQDDKEKGKFSYTGQDPLPVDGFGEKVGGALPVENIPAKRCQLLVLSNTTQVDADFEARDMSSVVSGDKTNRYIYATKVTDRALTPSEISQMLNIRTKADTKVGVAANVPAVIPGLYGRLMEFDVYVQKQIVDNESSGSVPFIFDMFPHALLNGITLYNRNQQDEKVPDYVNGVVEPAMDIHASWLDDFNGTFEYVGIGSDDMPIADAMPEGTKQMQLVVMGTQALGDIQQVVRSTKNGAPWSPVDGSVVFELADLGEGVANPEVFANPEDMDAKIDEYVSDTVTATSLKAKGYRTLRRYVVDVSFAAAPISYDEVYAEIQAEGEA